MQQAVKDAGIVLAGFVLLISVQVTRIAPSDSPDASGPQTAGLTPQTEAAKVYDVSDFSTGAVRSQVKPDAKPTGGPIILDFDGQDLPAPAAATHVDHTDHEWVVTLPQDLGELQFNGEFEFNGDIAEACSQVLVLIREAAEASGQEAIQREVKKVVQKAPCA